MDMAIANLFKHKVHFVISGELHDTNEPHLYSKGRQYISNPIENIEIIGVSNANDLCLKYLEPYIVHIISTIVHEERNHIDSITVTVTLMERSGEYYDYDYDLVQYTLDNPKYCIHLFSSTNETSIYSFPEHFLNEPFCIYVNALFYFILYHLRELEVMNWVASVREAHEEYYYTPPDETFRQDRCVICLESTPSILYLDCMHIAVCNSCDRMKRTVTLRKNCDTCRAEISRRIKI